jgi:hypothetical protein
VTLCYKVSIIPGYPQEEVLMQKSRSRSRVAQFQLFRPPQPSPSWPELPEEVQQKTLRLLAQLLREYRERVPTAESRQGVRHE